MAALNYNVSNPDEQKKCPRCGSNDIYREDIKTPGKVRILVGWKMVCRDCSYAWGDGFQRNYDTEWRKSQNAKRNARRKHKARIL